MIIWPSNSTAWVFFIPCCLHQAASALISTPRRTPGEWRKFPWLSGPHNGWLWKIPFKMDDFYGVRSISGKPRVFLEKKIADMSFLIYCRARFVYVSFIAGPSQQKTQAYFSSVRPDRNSSTRWCGGTLVGIQRSRAAVWERDEGNISWFMGHWIQL